jgi:DNA-binding transcriptional LysR family regulator
LLDLLDRLLQQLVDGAADLVVGLGDALDIEIVPDLLEDVVVALGVLRHHYLLGIGVGVGPRKTELLRSPMPEHPVAPGDRLEPELLIVRELLFECFLALVEGGGHAGLVGVVRLSAACIKGWDPQINSVCEVRPGRARRAAIVLPIVARP